MTSSTYPVRVDARLDAGLNRWLWLVNWLLAIPHYVVLAFLWLAFGVLSVIAFFAILFTGRYPRTIFEFNVGVLRWSWRVGYYAYGALGTDRYPPFTLRDVPEYPAHLDVDYPEHLSRGLVLVKWWLLAIPHYLVIGFFLGGGTYVVSQAANEPVAWVWDAGLISLLVLVAAVVLLFTGRYPQPVYDLVLGLNRWVLRVAAYVALMTDQYPPFRLDQGGDDAGGRLALSTPAGPSVAGAPDRTVARPAEASPAQGSPVGRGWTAGRVILLVCGCLGLLISLGIGAGGTALAVANTTARDDDGYLMSGDTSVATASYAVISDNLTMSGGAASELPRWLIGDAKVQVSTSGKVFVGVATTADVANYLRGVEYAKVVDVRGIGRTPVYRVSGTGTPSTPPADMKIWTAQATGSGTVSLVWPVEEGDWTVVLMNADGSAEVAGDVSVGATVPWLGWAAVILLVTAGLGTLLSVLLLVIALRERRVPGAR
jgi:hypothetical protein